MQHGFNYTSQPTHIPLLLFTHMWASEDDERWVGRSGKGRNTQEAQAIEERPSSRVKPLEASPSPYNMKTTSLTNTTTVAPNLFGSSWPHYLACKHTSISFYLLWRRLLKF